MTQRQDGILHTEPAVGGPVSGLGHTRVAVKVVTREQRLTGTVDVGLEIIVGFLVVTFPDEERATKEQVLSVDLHLSGQVLAQFRLYPALLVGTGIEGVECEGDCKHFTDQSEKLCRILLFLHIELLIGLFVLFLHTLKPDLVDAFVLLISRVLQQVGHQFLGLVKILPAFQDCSGIPDLLPLGAKRQRQQYQIYERNNMFPDGHHLFTCPKCGAKLVQKPRITKLI